MPTEQLHKQDIVCCNTNTNPSVPTLKICIEDEENSNEMTVVLKYDFSPQLYTQMYKSYENDLWRKKLVKNKWTFCCKLCNHEYKSFGSLKDHLNLHLSLYPYVCKICNKKYNGRRSVTKHLKRTHKVRKQKWDDFLTI